MVHASRHARHWGAYVAAGIVTPALAAVAVCFLLPSEHPVATRFEDFANAEDKAWSHDPDCDTGALAKIVSLRKQQQRTQNCAASADQHRQEERNAFEAIRSAEATQDAADMARSQATVSVWTLAFVILALGASGAAAVAAFRAAQAAEDALGRADQTLDHSRKSSETELRAYVHMVSVTPTFPPEGAPGSIVYIQTCWENLGQTPATNCVSEVNAMYVLGELPVDFDFPDPATANYRDQFSLGKSQTMYSEQLPMLISELNKTRIGGLCLYVWGWIDYDDMFAERGRRRTEFCVAGYGGFSREGARAIPAITS